MRTSSIHQVRNMLIVAVVVVLIGVTYFATSTPFGATDAKADVNDNISGFAWSSNIGWISLNSTSDASTFSYGVNAATTNRTSGGTNNLSGQAWSEHIGWISFNQSDLGGCPSLPCVAQINWGTGKITGWAKALAAGGGWDGWIKFSGTTTLGDPYGVSISGTGFSGYAWGGDVIGWIDFDPKIDTNGDGIIDDNDSVDNGAQISAVSCEAVGGLSDPNMAWGSCQPTGAVCGTVSYPSGATYTVDGVVVGACLVDGVYTGGTTVVACPGGATLICPDTSGPVSTSTKTRWWQF